MSFGNILKSLAIVKKYAPTVAALVSFENPALGALVECLSHLFNTDPADPAQLPQAIADDPKAIDKLASLENVTKIKTEIDFAPKEN